MGAMGVIVRHLKMAEEEPESPDMELSEGCQELSEEEEKLSEYHENLSETPPKLSGRKREVDHRVPKMANWQHKALSKAVISQEREPFPIVVTLLLGGVAVFTTIDGMQISVQAMAYVVTFMVCLIANPFHAVERFLALPSRWMVAITLFVMDLAITIPGKNTLIAAVIVSLLLMTLVMIGNKGWLINETYLATEYTRQAMRNDVEDRPFLSWRAHGKRELMTALDQAGLNITEYELNLGYRIAYRLGHQHGMTMIKADNRNLERLDEQIDELLAELEDMDKELKILDDCKEQCRKLQKEKDDLQTKTRELDDTIQDREADIYHQKGIITNLNKQIQEYKDYGMKEDAAEDLVKRMLEAGIVYRQIELVTGWNKFKVGEVKKKYNIELKGKQDE